MRASRGAAICVIAEGMNVHTTLGVRIVSGDVPGNSSGSGLGLLLEGDGTRDLGVSTDDSD